MARLRLFRPVLLPVAFLLTVFLILLAPAAEAQSGRAWVQIEAHPTLAEAESRARAYGGIFPDVEGFRLRSGWYAVALGPQTAAEAALRLRTLLGEGLVPRDSYVHDGSAYVSQFWPVAGGSLTAPDPQPDPQPDSQPAPQTEAVVTPVPVPVPPPVADETPAEARRSEALLTREERELIQTAMHWEGVYNSGIDGAFGPGTRKAMADWQASKGYDQTGVLTSRQRTELVASYQAVIASLGIETVRDNTAGIEMKLPLALVQKGAYQPPFAHYDAAAGSGVQVILISQEGDAATLFGLYDILQTLEILPLDGPRERRERSFVIEGRNAEIVSHAEARLTDAGNVKGFILIWPLNDDRRRGLALSEMQASFTAIGDSVLPDTAGDGGAQDIDLLSGLEIRRPDVARTGFYVDARGHVLTTADAVASCMRVTLDGDVPARVLGADPTLGLALLAPEVALVPIAIAHLQAAEPRLGSEIAVSGYGYDGRLGASVLTFGRLADLKGLDGSADLARLSLTLTGGEAGGPVFDGAGAVVGMLLPPAPREGQVLPEDVAFATRAPALTRFLTAQGIAPLAAEPAGDIAPEVLTTIARDITVQVSCWN